MAAEGSWFALVADEVHALITDGYSFDVAWSMAMKQLPPSVNDSGGWRPQLAINGDETVVGFFRHACENAVNDVRGPVGSGNGPALRHFCVETIRDVDAAAPARHGLTGPRFRQVA